jgi:DnaJ homolog subfamily C member 13
VVRCLHLTQLPKLLEAALDAVSALCANSVCQARLASAGAAWFGFALLTKYDFTLDEAVAAGVEASEESNAQLVYNARGRLAVTMLRRLGGYRNFGTSPHVGVRTAAQNILTSYLANLLDGATNTETMASSMTSLLKLINSASETPYLIWNHHTRAELLEFVGKRVERSYASPGTAPLAEADNLVYESLKAELKVGAVYVRVYAQHPSFPLTDATHFCVALLEYLTKHALFVEPPAAQMGSTLAKPEARVSAHVALALNAMLTLLISTHNFNVEEQLLGAGRLRVLLSYSHERQTASALTLALQLAMAICNSAKCVEALGADVHSMAHLQALLRCAPPHSEHVLRLFTALSANQNVVGALLHHGGLIHVLHLFAAAQLEVIELTDKSAAPPSGAPATTPAQDDAEPPAEPGAQDDAPAKMVKINWSDEQRALAGGLLCKLAADRLHGPRINERVKRLMPAVFVQTLADDAKRTVALFDASHENPELIWNASMRAELRSSLLHLSDEALASQRRDPTAPFELPADFVVEYVAC